MESQERRREESLSSQSPLLSSIEALDLSPVPASLGLAFAFASLILVRSQTLKPLSTAIKLADSAIKGTEALWLLHSPSPQSVFLATKAIVKSYKASKFLRPAESLPKIPSAVAARLKACLGAVSLLGYAKSPSVADGLLGMGFLKGGYKLSKNTAKVLEGFVGFQLNSGLRDGIDALGLLVKAATVGRQIKRWLSIEWRTGNRRECLFLRADLKHGVRLSYKRLDFDGIRGCTRVFYSEPFPLWEAAVIGEMAVAFHPSELLCLSVPVNEISKLCGSVTCETESEIRRVSLWNSVRPTLKVDSSIAETLEAGSGVGLPLFPAIRSQVFTY
ncbi:hypothetical protein MUK42_02849 [Musa troglodytarum]|uniref:Uncharacterized protein n=1 Tax=Musa troglodytarum TaxID=320322 RepID=A0A9E7EQL1_9LILI|nr:hypothetical protein MUK42_02849 [Musa troglodytarum]